MTPAAGAAAERPPVSVVVPYRGGAAGAERLLASLAELRLGPRDEAIIADNSEGGVVPETPDAQVIRATRERSSYYARNAGSADARGEWLLFIDSDCVPQPGLIDFYFSVAVEGDVGALAGSVVSDPEQSHFLARYATDRGFLDQDDGLHTARDAAATANLAVRRDAFVEVGGFEEGIRSAGDVDLCRRLVEAGWRIERRPEAAVHHLHRESLPDLLRTIARYAAGARWLDERYPGSAPPWPMVPGLLAAARDVAGDVMHRRFEDTAFRGVDAMGLIAHGVGYRRSNAAR